jgi:hypothetical protein
MVMLLVGIHRLVGKITIKKMERILNPIKLNKHLFLILHPNRSITLSKLPITKQLLVVNT